MPRISKANAQKYLLNALELFAKVTGEAVGATFTWNGKINVFGAEPYREYVTKHTEEVWQILKSSVHPPRKLDEPLSKPSQDRKNLQLISGDFSTLNVATLRHLVTWITQQSIGKSKTSSIKC